MVLKRKSPLLIFETRLENKKVPELLIEQANLVKDEDI